MRKLYHITLAILLLMLLATSCTSKNDRIISELNILLDSLKASYAPDTRIELWELFVHEEDGMIELSGEVADEEAFLSISKAIDEQFGEVNNALVLLPGEGTGQIVNGLINNSVGHMRSEPDHMSDIVSEALLGTPVRVMKKEGNWFLIQTPNLYLGWIDSAALVQISPELLLEHKTKKKIIFTEQYGFSYANPNEKSEIVSDLVIGCILPVVSSETGFFQIEYPDGRIAWVKKTEVMDISILITMEPEASALLNVALKFNGIPYLWGGASSKAIDCSGFTSLVYFMNGVQLMRDASQQVQYGKMITSEYKYDELEVGDLLFFGRWANETHSERVTHVAMYIGDSEFIHSSGRVRINSMEPERKNFIPEYSKRFIRAMRIIGVEDEGYQAIRENKYYKEII